MLRSLIISLLRKFEIFHQLFNSYFFPKLLAHGMRQERGQIQIIQPFQPGHRLLPKR